MRKLLGVCLVLSGAMSILAVGCTPNREVSSESETVSVIKVGGSAEAYEILELLTDAYSAQSDKVEFDYDTPSQTAGGIQGVKAEILDIGAVSRQIASEESESLIYYPLVKAPLVLAVHNSVTGVSELSTEQLKDIYSGNITNWQALGGPDVPIALFDLSEDENEKKVLRTVIGENLEITADAIVFNEDDELLESVASTDFSFAAVPFEDELEDLPVTILSLDGQAPSAANIASGDYGMNMVLGMTLLKTTDDNVQAFADFVVSPEGQQILTDSEYIALKAN